MTSRELERLQQLGKKAKIALQPFVIQAGASMTAYAAGLAAMQGLGMALRVSTATPVLGPAGGVMGVGIASALAGQAALAARAYNKDGFKAIADARAWKKRFRQEDILIDATLGIALFKIMGGRFRTVMPSNVTKIGAAVRSSVPAPGVEYASAARKIELKTYFRTTGCHHCGSRVGSVVGDHMPPNHHVRLHQSQKPWARSPLLKWVANALNIPTGPPRQRYYPQCLNCSSLQSSAVRNGKTRLVFHEVFHRGGVSSAWHAAGVILGLRHMMTQAVKRK